MFDGCVALRDREQAGEARLRCEQVVVMRVQPVGAHVVADVEQSKVLVVERREIHRQGQGLSLLGHLRERRGQSGCRLLALIERIGQRRSPSSSAGSFAGGSAAAGPSNRSRA